MLLQGKFEQGAGNGSQDGSCGEGCLSLSCTLVTAKGTREAVAGGHSQVIGTASLKGTKQLTRRPAIASTGGRRVFEDQPMVCKGRGRRRNTSGRVKVQDLEPLRSGSWKLPIQDAEFLPELPERHLDRDILCALGSWRCSLLGLLLGMCAPGGCEPNALDGGFGVLGCREPLPTGTFVKTLMVGPHATSEICFYHLMESQFFASLDSLHPPVPVDPAGHHVDRNLGKGRVKDILKCQETCTLRFPFYVV